ncbi:MAG: hypothetical protein GOV02_03205 [Candidatus Aenigmarchaeota archaeon]|nr:hypothetical protein [Candidatus Aenigmarchaeota archaeon]
MDWKKFITPGIIVVVIISLVGIIYNGLASELNEKADNKTIQMYILQQEKDSVRRDKFSEEQKKENELKQRELELKQRELELKQKELETKQSGDDDKFMMQQKSLEQLIEVLKEK